MQWECEAKSAHAPNHNTARKQNWLRDTMLNLATNFKCDAETVAQPQRHH